MAESKKLSPALEGKFKMVGSNAPGKYVHGNVNVDLSACSEQEADNLIAVGCKVVERVTVVPKAPDKKA